MSGKCKGPEARLCLTRKDSKRQQKQRDEGQSVRRGSQEVKGVRAGEQTCQFIARTLERIKSYQRILRKEMISPALHLTGIITILPHKFTVKLKIGTSLVAQWLRIRLPMQGTWVQALVWDDPTCRGATKPVCHNY